MNHDITITILTQIFESVVIYFVGMPDICDNHRKSASLMESKCFTYRRLPKSFLAKSDLFFLHVLSFGKKEVRILLPKSLFVKVILGK